MMEKDKNFGQSLKAALERECEAVSASSQLKARIDEQINRKQEEKSMSRISMKKMAIGVAAACLLVSGSVFAGHVSGFVMSSSSRPEYTSYEQLSRAEEKIGYSADYVENFGNGYHFAGAVTTHIEAKDENRNTVYTEKGLSIRYQKEGGADLNLDIEQNRESSWEVYSANTADSVRTCGNVTMYYDVITNKFVPVDYELTDEDKANMERDDYNLAVGSDSVMINQSMSVRWEKDGILYTLYGFNVTLGAEEMLDMAEEIINAQ
ncbi:MAG: hypothetical protein NC434_06885 [Ruminococcus sp.]|nr:hypothetical protein [Ruminococcus sp.]